MSRIYYFSLLSAFLLLVTGSNVQAQKTAFHISGIQSARGNIVLSFFKDNETFKAEKPFKSMTFSKAGLANGTLVVAVNVTPGIYGFALLDDENNNGLMDKSMIKMPKEGFGFSNFYLDKLKRPVFNDFKTEIKPGNNKVLIKVKYL